MNRTLRELGRAAVSAVGVGLLVIGVPILLIGGVGWPLPRTAPDLDGLRQSLQGGVNDQVIVNTLAVIAWALWAQLAAAIVAELTAVFRGRPAVHLPVLPGIQGVAEHLVGGILLFATITQPAAAFATPAPVVAAAAPSMPIVEPIVWRGAAQEPPTAAVVSDPSRTDLPTVTVQRHDSYWAIAERVLGDGMRWQEVHELNAGRTLADGSVIPAGDDTLRTGWVLLLPADAVVAPEPVGKAGVPAEPVESVRPTKVTVEGGDNLWSLAASQLQDDLGRRPSNAEVAPYWSEVIDENQDRYVEAGNPNLILPGQELVMPPTGHITEVDAVAPAPPLSTEPAPEIEDDELDEQQSDPPPSIPTVPTTALPNDVQAGQHLVPDAGAAGEDGDRGGLAAVVAGGLASVALAVGLKRLIGRRRRRFAAERGRPPAPTPTDLRPTHQAVVAHADEDYVDELRALLVAAARSMAKSGSPRRPRVVRHGPSGCEVIPDHPDVHPPEGWQASVGGHVWTSVAPSTDGEASPPLTPTPLLVTIGQPEAGDQLYLDLEADGIVALTGDRDVAADLARSVLVELTLSPLADNLRVVTVGNLIGSETGALEHLTVAASWADIAADVTNWASESHHALVENEWPSTFVARAAEPNHDGLVPIAVVADTPPPEEVLEVLRSARPCAVAVVLVGECSDDATAIHCTADAICLVDLDLECRPQQLDAAELAEVCQLLETFDPDTDEETPEEADSEGGPAIVLDREPASTELVPAPNDRPPEFDVLVRLLGDITVEGGKPLKPKATSVVAYLAMNRAVTTDRLVEACWYGTDGVSQVKRLRDTMTEIRDALGSQHFPVNRQGTYTVGPRVGTDLDLFEWHVRRAASLGPVESSEHLLEALALVARVPFSYSNAARASFGWVDLEHHASAWEHQIGLAGCALSAIVRELPEPTEAINGLRRVVAANPLNSGLVGALMQSLVATAQVRSAERVLSDHSAALDAAELGEPSEELIAILKEVRPGSVDGGRGESLRSA